MYTVEQHTKTYSLNTGIIWPAVVGPLLLWLLILYLPTKDLAGALGVVTVRATVAFAIAQVWKGRKRDWCGFSKVFFWAALLCPTPEYLLHHYLLHH